MSEEVAQPAVDHAELQAVQFDADQLRTALKADAEFFIQFFMGDLLTTPVPDIHKEIFGLMTGVDVNRFVCAIPRDHAKTTLAKLTCVWYFLFHQPTRFIAYLSNTAAVAIPAVKDVMDFLESPNCKAVFGPVEYSVKQDGVGYYEFTIAGKSCILRAQGAGGQVRGLNIQNQRPNLVVIDDLESTEGAHSIATEESFKKLKTWFYGPFLKALDGFNSKIIQIGNMLSTRSLLYLHCKSRFWYSRVYGCIRADGTPLWPGKWSIESLRLDFEQYQEMGETELWFAEMMNMPMSGVHGLIKSEQIGYAPQMHPSDSKIGFITVDLAISMQDKAHKTTVTVHKWNIDRQAWQIADYEGGQLDPIQLWRLIVRLAFKWRIRVIGIEDEAYQASLQYVFPHFARLEGVKGLLFVPLSTGKKHKYIRLEAWAATLKSGHWLLTEGDFILTQQLLSYNKTKKENDDDYIDSAAYGPQMEQRYAAEIMVEYEGPEDTKGTILSAVDICGV